MGSSPRSISARPAWCVEVVSGTAVEALVKREDIVVLAALVVLVVLAWLALFTGAGTGMDPFAMTGWLLPVTPPVAAPAWTLSYWLVVFFMWAAMMVAMMLPSASPMVLLYARVAPQAEAQGRDLRARAAIPAFASGYFAIWILFSLLAVIVHWGLERLGALSAMMSLSAGLLSGALLIAAGLYQLTPLKAACLTHCRTPASFLAAHWRKGVVGAWRMGLTHGLYCLGCCAVLMGLLFVGGVMNLIWVAGLTLLVTIEKLAPFGAAAAKTVGAILIAGGAALVLAAW
jgi:predicted metal-binding membrane protein